MERETYTKVYLSSYVGELPDKINKEIGTEIAPGLIARRVISLAALSVPAFYAALVVWEVEHFLTHATLTDDLHTGANAHATVHGGVFDVDTATYERTRRGGHNGQT